MLSPDKIILKRSALTAGGVMAELAGFWCFIYGLFYVLSIKWLRF